MTARDAALDAACERMRPHADALVSAVRRRDRQAVAAVLAGARTVESGDADPGDVLAVVLAEKCVGLATAAGLAV